MLKQIAIILTISQLCSQGALAATFDTQTLQFPTDYSIGKLYVLNDKYQGEFAREYVTKQAFNARGTVNVKRGLRLSLVGNYALTEHMNALSRLPADSLIHLDLRKLEIESPALANVINLRSLWQLELENTDINDDGLPFLSTLTKLKCLGLSKTLITGRTLGALQNMTDLISLDLGRTRLDQKYLPALPKIKNLLSLRLDECGITDSGMHTLALMPNLCALSLKENKGITDKGLAELRSIKTLGALQLDGTPISDNGFKQLSKCHLRTIYLRRDQLSDAKLQQVKKLMPHTEFVLNDTGHLPLEVFSPLR